jgi:hypothetical protein
MTVKIVIRSQSNYNKLNMEGSIKRDARVPNSHFIWFNRKISFMLLSFY